MMKHIPSVRSKEDDSISKDHVTDAMRHIQSLRINASDDISRNDAALQIGTYILCGDVKQDRVSEDLA